MKTLIVSLSLFVCSLSAFAQVYFEPFANATNSGGTAYNTGDNLAGQINLQNDTQTNQWVPVGTNFPGGSQVTIGSGSVNVTNTLPTGTGNSAFLQNQVGIGGRFNIGAHSTSTNMTLFYSAFIQVNDISALAAPNTAGNGGGAFNLGFNNSTGAQGTEPSVIGATLYYGATNGGYILGTGRNTGSTGNRFWETNTATPHQVGEILFVVLEYEAVPGTLNDLARLWINPNPSTFGTGSYPTPDVIVGDASHTPTSDADLTTINSFVLLNRNATTPTSMVVDELRIGTTWADVTPSTNAVTIIPTLSISKLDPSTVQLSWHGDATGFTLQGTGQILSSGTPWADIGPGTTSGTNFVVTDTISGMKFYRLKK